MEVQEFDDALTDLETRVDRLRALYENWFRGYEKTEPSVARKDVERRVYGLRKQLPRNTALRFRYHQLYQRYTTLASYWQRTARQVEEGTYRMQLQRLRRRKEGLAQRSLAPRALDEDDDQGETLPPKSYELKLDETLDVSSLLDALELEQVGAALDAPAPLAEERSATLKPVARFSRPAGLKPSNVPPTRPSLTLESLQSFGGLPAIAASGGAPLKPAVDAPVGRSAAPAPPRPAAASLPAPRPSAPGASPAPGGAGSHSGAMPRPPAPHTSSGAGNFTAPSSRLHVPAPPSPAGPPRAPAPSLPSTAAARAPAPPVSRPLAPPTPPTSKPAATLGEPQIRRIYDEYVAARRKNNEGEVRYETLASSIHKMLPDLEKRHQGKQIDFEVVLKGGRVGLKPKAT